MLLNIPPGTSHTSFGMRNDFQALFQMETLAYIRRLLNLQSSIIITTSY